MISAGNGGHADGNYPERSLSLAKILETSPLCDVLHAGADRGPARIAGPRWLTERIVMLSSPLYSS